MTTYTKAQSKKVKTKVFSATTSKGSIQVKAYLKENALTRLQEIDPTISFQDISILKYAHNSHQSPVDQIVEIDTEKSIFTIEMNVNNQ